MDTHGATSNPWRLCLLLNGVPTEFDIDTGAEVSVISKPRHTKIGSPSLSLPNKTLRGPSNYSLHVSGFFTGVLKHRRQEVQQNTFVVQHLRRNLLGRPAIEALGLVVRVGAVFDGGTSPVQLFPQMFQGLGKLEGEYVIKLKPDSKPFAISVPTRVAVPLMGKVRAELERMERLGVIAKVEVPTDWCAGMVVVPKPNGDVSICVDLTKLNQSVCRERHPLPAVEQTLAQLAGAQVFTKLDANSGFWQIPLSADSSLLTTFLTPFGRYCGLTLNREKCEFSQSEVKFLGQMVDKNGVCPDKAKVRAIQEVSKPKNVSDVRRFLGMVNQLGKFSPNLAEKTRPIRELLQKDAA